MESVINQIRQAREDDHKKKPGILDTETVVDGCQVKMRFSETGDSKAITAIQSLLISAYMSSVFTPLPGGEYA
jgi:hypothetical protein